MNSTAKMMPVVPTVLWTGNHYLGREAERPNGYVECRAVWMPKDEKVRFEFSQGKDAMGAHRWAELTETPAYFLKEAASLMVLAKVKEDSAPLLDTKDVLS